MSIELIETREEEAAYSTVFLNDDYGCDTYEEQPAGVLRIYELSPADVDLKDDILKPRDEWQAEDGFWSVRSRLDEEEYASALRRLMGLLPEMQTEYERRTVHFEAVLQEHWGKPYSFEYFLEDSQAGFTADTEKLTFSFFTADSLA